MTIQVDYSGRGHAWKAVDAESLPANILLEIEGEIFDGGHEAGELVASNGLSYRWSN